MGQIERRIAPFWRGLNDHSTAWTENQLVAVARGLPLPAPDDIPVEDTPLSSTMNDSQASTSKQDANSLTNPVGFRSPSYHLETPSVPLEQGQPSSIGPSTPSSGSALFKGRAKTFASLTTSAKIASPAELTPREVNLPPDPFINGQRLEAYLYKDATECPICFLYYPPYLNRTRCCDQDICSECFVQIKRPEPHLPEHADPSQPTPPPTDPESGALEDEGELISEPASCPFCVQPEFGIIYESPPFRRGLTYVTQISNWPMTDAASAMSSSTSLASSSGRFSPVTAARRRNTSLSVTSTNVITTDRVRPDWATKLATARAHTARRSAAATALHTAAYLMGNQSDGRSFGFGRRRRTNGESGLTGPSTSAQLNMLAALSERYAASARAGSFAEGGPLIEGASRGSSRSRRMEDLEDMMLMEAVRQSLAEEEERRKREEKEAKKESKKREKENKKAEKVAKKAGVYQAVPQNSPGLAGLPHRTSSGYDTSFQGEVKKKSAGSFDAEPSVSDTGVPTHSSADLTSSIGPTEQFPLIPRTTLQPGDARYPSISYGPASYRQSHLRTLSNASSTTSSADGSLLASSKHGPTGSNSSFEPSPHGSGVNISTRNGLHQEHQLSATPPGGGAGLDSMFNFSSLAQMIDQEAKARNATHVEHAEPCPNRSDLQNEHPLISGHHTDSSTYGIGASEQSSSSRNLEEAVLIPEVRVATPSEVGAGSEKYTNQGTHDFKDFEVGVAKTIS